MDTEKAAAGFAALGAGPRLDVVRSLVRAGRTGLSVGALQKRTGLAPSTLAHHLRTLVEADLVIQRKEGRSVVNVANFDGVEALGRFVLEECCSDESVGAAREGSSNV